MDDSPFALASVLSCFDQIASSLQRCAFRCDVSQYTKYTLVNCAPRLFGSKACRTGVGCSGMISITAMGCNAVRFLNLVGDDPSDDPMFLRKALGAHG